MGKIASVCIYMFVYILSAFMLKKTCNRIGIKEKVLFVFAIGLPVFLAALRYMVGTDFLSYLWIFRDSSSVDFGQWMKENLFVIDGRRFGIWFICRLAGLFDSSQMFYGLFALIIYLPVAFRLKKEYSENICFLAAFLFLCGLFTSGFNIMKQAAAISIIFDGLHYVYEQKFLKYCAVVLMACCFHVSAAVCFFIYFLWDSEMNSFCLKKWVIISGSIIGVAFIPKILLLVGGRFSEYGSYTGTISNKSFYLNMVLCMVFLVLYKRYTMIDKRNALLISMVFIGLVMELTGFYSPYIKRIALYYSFPQFILLAQLPQLVRQKDRKIARLVVFVYTAVIFIVSSAVLGQSDIIPYRFAGGYYG